MIIVQKARRKFSDYLSPIDFFMIDRVFHFRSAKMQKIEYMPYSKRDSPSTTVQPFDLDTGTGGEGHRLSPEVQNSPVIGAGRQGA